MNDLLPIPAYRDQIINAVSDNQITIIRGETGSGKSTQVPQILQAIASRIIVTQPRRSVARALAARVAEEVGCVLGTDVGFRTATDHCDNPTTRILYCTDGLQLVRELIGVGAQEVLVIDEVHEWNLSIELLIAWTRLRMLKIQSLKLVIMSATMDASEFSDFFHVPVQIVDIPGRSFPILERNRGQSPLTDAIELLQQGHNVLVFQPGKGEVRRMIRELENRNIDADILPLYGGMTLEDQIPCFLHYPRPKCVVSTNVAQTSITVPDIDAVVDTGLARQTAIVSNIEGLHLKPISLADRQQRKGRAGRTKPGIYVDHCPLETERREAFTQPEILRTPLDHLVLRLKVIGIEASDFPFVHQPDQSALAQAQQTLFRIGCVDQDGNLTGIGRMVAELPTPPRFGRMIVEALRRGVTNDILSLVAITLTQDITEETRRFKQRETESDAFVQLNAYDVACQTAPDQLPSIGINPDVFQQISEMRNYLATYVNGRFPQTKTSGHRDDILYCLCTGLIDFLHKRSVTGDYKNRSNEYRKLGSESVVSGAEYIVGLPYNLQRPGALGPRTTRIMRLATRVDIDVLQQQFPHLVTKVDGPVLGRDYFKTGKTMGKRRTYFDDLLIKIESTSTVP